jgi:hypothetical protein
MLSVNMLNVIMLNVVMLNVVAPIKIVEMEKNISFLLLGVKVIKLYFFVADTANK